MKKQVLLNIISLAVFFTAAAQKPDTARILIHYKFIHVQDTTDRDHPYLENRVLYIGKNASAYWNYDGIVMDEQFKKAWSAAAAASPDGNVRINRSGVPGAANQNFQYPNEQKMLTRENVFGNNYVVESAIPVINWKISNDTASFGGLHCQKATGHFKGRDYIAWFCADLPMHTGPWKLSGLPGVIVDAHDTRNEVIFKFDGIEKAVFTQSAPIGGANTPEKDLPPILRGLNYNPNLITPPANSIATTEKEFDKLKKAVEKNPQAFAQGVVAANRAEGTKMDQLVVAPMRGPVVNNPIELPERP